MNKFMDDTSINNLSKPIITGFELSLTMIRFIKLWRISALPTTKWIRISMS